MKLFFLKQIIKWCSERGWGQRLPYSRWKWHQRQPCSPNWNYSLNDETWTKWWHSFEITRSIWRRKRPSKWLRWTDWSITWVVRVHRGSGLGGLVSYIIRQRSWTWGWTNWRESNVKEYLSWWGCYWRSLRMLFTWCWTKCGTNTATSRPWLTSVTRLFRAMSTVELPNSSRMASLRKSSTPSTRCSLMCHIKNWSFGLTESYEVTHFIL